MNGVSESILTDCWFLRRWALKLYEPLHGECQTYLLQDMMFLLQSFFIAFVISEFLRV